MTVNVTSDVRGRLRNHDEAGARAVRLNRHRDRCRVEVGAGRAAVIVAVVATKEAEAEIEKIHAVARPADHLETGVHADQTAGVVELVHGPGQEGLLQTQMDTDFMLQTWMRMHGKEIWSVCS